MQRIGLIAGHLTGNSLATKKPDTLSVTDNRTGNFDIVVSETLGKTYELALKHGAINGNELAKIVDDQQQTLKLYDPGYVNVINCVRNKKFFHS